MMAACIGAAAVRANLQPQHQRRHMIGRWWALMDGLLNTHQLHRSSPGTPLRPPPCCATPRSAWTRPGSRNTAAEAAGHRAMLVRGWWARPASCRRVQRHTGQCSSVVGGHALPAAGACRGTAPPLQARPASRRIKRKRPCSHWQAPSAAARVHSNTGPHPRRRPAGTGNASCQVATKGREARPPGPQLARLAGAQRGGQPQVTRLWEAGQSFLFGKPHPCHEA